MKTLLRMGLCAALLSSVAFARNPHEHRGFYFSAGIGPAYHSFSASSSSSSFATAGMSILPNMTISGNRKKRKTPIMRLSSRRLISALENPSGI